MECQESAPSMQEGTVEREVVDAAKQVFECQPHVMEKLSGVSDAGSMDMVAVVAMPEQHQLDEVAKCTRVLALDRVQDPGNLGTLVRTAAALDWDAVFLLPGCCDPFNDKALR